MAENDLSFDPDDEGGDQGSGQGDPNKNFADLRAAYNREKKARREAEAKAEELTKFQAQVLEERADAAVTAVFTEAKVNPKLASVYRRLNPDVEIEKLTKEAAVAFAQELGLPVAAPVDETKTKDADEGAEGFTPASAGTGEAVTAGSKKITPAELAKLLSEDPAAADAAVKAGRVDYSPEAERVSDTRGSIEFVLPK